MIKENYFESFALFRKMSRCDEKLDLLLDLSDGESEESLSW